MDLFVLMLNIPVNNFISHVGTENNMESSEHQKLRLHI